MIDEDEIDQDVTDTYDNQTDHENQHNSDFKVSTLTSNQEDSNSKSTSVPVAKMLTKPKTLTSNNSNEFSKTQLFSSMEVISDYKIIFMIFMIMGSGANWVLATALAQEIPYFELYQPERLCVATYMTLANNFGIVALSIYIYINTYYYKIPYKYSVQFMLSLSPFGCILTAFTYNIVYNGTSFWLYVCCAIGGTIGALASVVMNPFLMSYENNFISATRAGGSGAILLTAIFSVIQNPGGNTRFGVTLYMIIFFAILSFPLFAFYYILKKQIGLRKVDKAVNDDILLDHKSVELTSFQSNESEVNSTYDSNDTAVQMESLRGNTVDSTTNVRDEELNPLHENKHYLDSMMDKIYLRIIPKKFQENFPWLLKAFPYMVCVAWVDFNNFGVLAGTFPFALSYATGSVGANYLAVGYQTGAVALICGDLSTTLFHIPFRYSISIFTGCCCFIYLCAVETPGFQSASSGPFMIILYFISQFLEAHILTVCYRTCASKFPLQYREDASRNVGIWDQVGTTLGAVTTAIVISQVASCS